MTDDDILTRHPDAEFYGEYKDVDPARGSEVQIAIAQLEGRMTGRLRDYRRRHPGALVLRKDVTRAGNRVVSDLVVTPTREAPASEATMSLFYEPSAEALARNENDFRWHKPTVEAGNRMATIRQSCSRLADFLLTACPAGRDLSLALTKLKEAQMWAISSIACGEPDAPDPSSLGGEHAPQAPPTEHRAAD